MACNIAYLCGYDPGFEEAALVVGKEGPPALPAGNEGMDYAEVAVPIAVERHLVQCLSLSPADSAKNRQGALRRTSLEASMGQALSLAL